MRISILLAFLLSINALAQESFVSMRGKLIDKESKEPIPYASIYVKGKSIGTTSNDDGKFSSTYQPTSVKTL
jgi:CarboxypepD_reg-like domain